MNMNEVPQLLSFPQKSVMMSSVLYWWRAETEARLNYALTCASQFLHAGRRTLQDSLTSLSRRAVGLDKWLAWWETFITLLTLQHTQLWNRSSEPTTHTQHWQQTHRNSLKWNLRGCAKHSKIQLVLSQRCSNGRRHRGLSDAVVALKCVDRLSQLCVHQHADELRRLMIHCH